MQWLDAILAFSITMLILSMVTTTIVETIHRSLALRWRGLQRMLVQLFDNEILPVLKADKPELTKGSREETDRKVNDQRRAFLDVMMKNRSKPDNSRLDRTKPGLIPALMANQSIARLTKDDFIDRLASSRFGELLVKQAKKKVSDQVVSNTGDSTNGEKEMVHAAIKDVAQKFDGYGQDSSVTFERRARFLSVAVALLVAWVFYVHPYDLLTTYLKRPELTQKVIAQGDEALLNYEKLNKKLEETAALLKGEDKKDKPGETKPQPANAAGNGKNEPATDPANEATTKGPEEKAKPGEPESAPKNEPGSTEKNVKEALKKLEDAFKTGREEVEKLQALKIPLGWTDEKITSGGFRPYGIWCKDGSWGCPLPRPQENATDEAAASKESAEDKKAENGEQQASLIVMLPTKLNSTVLWLLAGGVLIGLGAPFWAKTVTSFTRIRSVTQSLRGSAGGSGTAPQQPESNQPTTDPLVTVFAASANASKIKPS